MVRKSRLAARLLAAAFTFSAAVTIAAAGGAGANLCEREMARASEKHGVRNQQAKLPTTHENRGDASGTARRAVIS